MNVREILLIQSTRYGIKPAVIFEEDSVSFFTLKENVFKLANALQKLGVKQGDKIAVYLPNSLEYIYSYLACFCLGVTCVPLDYMLKNDELISCLGHAEVKILIAQDKADISLDEIKKNVPSLRKIILCRQSSEKAGRESYLNFFQLIQKETSQFNEVKIVDSDPALIMYTSGTTGKPKGILLNYKHLDGSPQAMKHFVDFTDQDIKLCALPLSHIAGLIYVQNCIIFSITLILMGRFNPFEFLQDIEKYKVTCFHIVPAMYNAILTLKQIDRFNLSSLRWMVVFGAPSSPEILERFHKYCPNAQLLNGWGMTETCPPNTVTPLGSTNIASIGKPAPHCKIKIVDENDKELPSGQIGEITISGWIVMQEYYKDPEATKEMKKNGWLYTGDLGRMDKDGFLYIMGRKKEMIKVGGQIVYAPEVESALYKHEAVAEAAVIGIADKLRGEAIKAFVALKEGSQVTAEDLRFFAKDHLANFKIPQEIELRSSLPKNRTGKIDKEELKKETIIK
ncbi:MAG: hypothetical protein A2Z88_03975 [Omnitrophica WOR_2 bacterium GWA2_47_8]|nr:MAG: hypothetical protein A2Z88_03975 [Omnitrophica WOR_2 bacterium GWA2_47_8]